ncbi:hypothetical protein ACKWTF_015767 [Chironomus riparius]
MKKLFQKWPEMIVKIFIVIFIGSLNYVSNFPIENLSIDSNKSESDELMLSNGTNSNQTDVNFELIHDNDENTKNIKKRDATDQDNSAENHINHKDNQSHNQHGFSYQRPSNVPKDSLESHHGTKIDIKKTTNEHSDENLAETILQTTDSSQNENSTLEVDHSEDQETNNHQTEEHITEQDYHSNELSKTALDTDSTIYHSTSARINDDKHDYSTQPYKSTSKIDQNSEEPNHDCEDSDENIQDNLNNSTKKMNTSDGTHQRTTRPMDHNMTTTKIDKINKTLHNPGKYGNSSSTVNDKITNSTELLKASTKSSLKSTNNKSSTKPSIDPVLHQSTNHLGTTGSYLINSTRHYVNHTNKLTNNPKTTQIVHNSTVKVKNSTHNIKTNKESNSSSHVTSLRTTQRVKSSRNHTINSEHDPSHSPKNTTNHSNNQNLTTHQSNPKHV